jgi:hypothetical protein
LPTGDDLSGPTLRAQSDDYAAVRSDGLIIATGLGEQWTPFHASQGYAFGQCIREQADENGLQADLLSLGTLYGGRRWFLTYDLGSFNIGEYSVRDYLSINGSYDSSWPLQVLSSPIIEVCANTVAAAKHFGTTHYRYKHTSGIFDRVEEAKRALGRHRANAEAFKAVGERLLATPVTPVQYSNLVDALFPTDDDVPVKTKNSNDTAIQKVSELYKAQVGSNVVSESGNAWAFVQAVNTYENWGSPIRKTAGRSEAETRALRQIEQLNDGKQKLTATALDLVGAI